jgi:hypothetical protein
MTEHLSYADLHSDPAPPPIGHNNPPKTPFDASRERIESLYAEAKNWCDGEPITSQAQADELQKLLRLIQDAEREADERRKIEAKPFDDGKAEVQARYNPLIQKDRGMTSMAVQACKSALAPWLRKLEEEQRKAAEEARRVAEEARKAAEEAVRQRDAIANLEQREAFENVVAEAALAEDRAKRAEKARPVAKGIGRAASLRTYYVPEVTDYREFARFVWSNHMDDIKPMLDELAKRYVDMGRRSLPGVTVHEDKRVA